MTDELPEGWASTELGTVIRGFEAGRNLRSQGRAAKEGEVGVLKISAVTWGTFRPEENKALLDGDAPKPHERIQSNDLLITRANTSDLVGAVVLVRSAHPNLMLPDKILRIQPLTGMVDPRFLLQALRTPSAREHFEANATGTSDSMRNLTQPNIAAVPIRIAPLPEQHRIVEKVEALLEQVNRAKERLGRVPLILKRFRQAVLAAACSGELTREWRERHPVLQPARDLLVAISARRTALKLPTASRLISDEGIEIPESELPDSWRWCRVGQIADVRLGGTPARKEPSYWDGSIPWVSSGEVANCRINGTTERITKKGLESSNAKVYPAGSVLIAMIGEGKTRGQSAILDIDACTNQNVAGLVFDAGLVNPEYVWYWALQEYTKNRDEGRGGNQAALNGAKVRALPLPLPPLNEQAEIVRVLKNMLRLASAIDARVKAAAARANKLPQAILSKAFSGELVPTEAELARLEGRTYETAEELLKRVTALGSDAASAGKGRGRRARKAE